MGRFYYFTGAMSNRNVGTIYTNKAALGCTVTLASCTMITTSAIDFCNYTNGDELVNHSLNHIGNS